MTINLLSWADSTFDGSYAGIHNLIPTPDTQSLVQGKYSARVVADGSLAYQGVYFGVDASALTPGATYTASYYLMAPAGLDMEIIVKRSDTWGYLGNATVTQTGAWLRMQQTFTAPNPAPPAGTSIYIFADTGPTPQAVTFWIDAAQLETGSTATPFVAGTAGAPPPAPRGLQVIHAGQDISAYVRELEDGEPGGNPADFTLESSLAQGANTAGAAGAIATFTVTLGPAAKAVGKASQATGSTIVRQGDVQIYDARQNLIFGGHVTKLDDASYGVNTRTIFNCVDYWQALDRVEVQQVFTGQSDVAIITSLLTSYAPWVDQSLLPATGNYVFAKRVCKGTLRDVLQAIADVTGFLIWIDPESKIHYASPSSSSTAPFDLSDNPNSITSFGYALTKYEVDDNAIINRVYFYGGKNTSPDFIQDLSPQANGTNTTFLLAYPPDNAADGAKHIVLNGVELVVGSVFDKTTNGQFKSQGGTADVLLNATQQIALFDVAPLATDTLSAKYRYQTPLVVVLSDQQSYNFYGGWFDGRIADKTVYDVQTALQRCRLKLAQHSRGLVSISLTTWTPGLQAGQLVKLTNKLRGIDETYLVQKVTSVPLGHGEFEYDVDLGAWNWNLLDLLVQNARANNPVDDYTEEDTTVIQAHETATAATAVVAITKSTHTSAAYYSGQPGTQSGFFTVQT